jgi:hypothetical protein
MPTKNESHLHTSDQAYDPLATYSDKKIYRSRTEPQAASIIYSGDKHNAMTMKMKIAAFTV